MNENPYRNDKLLRYLFKGAEDNSHETVYIITNSVT